MQMKKSAKVAVVAAATLAAGSLGFAIPALAHDRFGSETEQSERHEMEMHEHSRVTLDAQITGIPADVTSAREAHHGAYFTVFLLDGEEASAQMPEEGGKRISIRPEHSEDGGFTEPTIENGTLSGLLGFRAPFEEGVTKLALYPSDGSAVITVTIEVDAEGNATATSSSPLSVAYSADVAVQAPEAGEKHPGFRGKGHGHHRGEMGPSFGGERVTPNA
jgi:hypothetical protein